MKFCGQCAAPLAAVCSSCGTSNPPDNKFCGQCAAPLRDPGAARFATPAGYTPKHLAEKILTSRGALEGERKLVTVLFVDVSGFTALSEKLDPEDVHQLMDQAFELMLGEIHHYEGTVNQFLGDGLMALFGAPIAHEDHALRAAQAALGIQRALVSYRERLSSERRIDFRVRMGMNLGTVVVGKIGDNLRMDYTAVGDTTNLAARLLALAEPGQILVSEEMARIAGQYLRLQPLGEVAVKGKTLPVRAYCVEGMRSVRDRIEAISDVGLTPLVGRDRELALLLDRFAEAREGRGQAILVFGEAGIGKSRLLSEFRREASAGARWLIGRCVSYGHGISYLPVLDTVRDLLGIEEADRAETVLAKIDGGIAELGNDLGWTAPFVRALLSLDPGDPNVSAMIPEQRRGRTLDALRALVTRLSERGPVVVLVEDLHWIDTHSEEVVRVLLDRIATLPIMVVLTYRPGYAQPFGDQTYHTRITLHGLPEAQTAAMVERVFGSAEVPAEIRELIKRKAEGNPLFVEELSKTLVEDGTVRRENGGYRLARSLADLAIPETIQGVIMARIDRLPETLKSALQIASVIGREFTARLVERVSAMEREAPKVLGELRAVELIYEKSVYPELAYMFKHALTHDVAYESLLKQRRRALHRRVGEVIEELYPDRLPEFFETLAWHYAQGEVWDRAVHYLLAAVAKSRAHFAFADCVRYAREAVAILDRHRRDAAAQVRALEAVGDFESLQGRLEEANVVYDRAISAATDVAARDRIENKRHREGVAVRDGARIAYYQHGTRGPALLFVHPMLYGIATFQSQVELLSQDFRIVTFDPRGTGKSDPIPGAYYIRDHVADVRSVIEGVGLARVVCIGNSAGASVAVNFAAAHPELVEKLVVVGAHPTTSRAPDYPVPIDNSWREPVIECVRAGNYEQALRLFMTRAFSEPGGRALVDIATQGWSLLPVETIQNFFKQVDPARELRPLLPTLRMPTLVLHGDEDLMAPVAAGRYLAEHIRGAQFYAFKGRCHGPNWTAPDEFARVLRSFVLTGRVS